MGYMRHHAIIVTSWENKHVRQAAVEAKKACARNELRTGLVSNIRMSDMNGYGSFTVYPDGSKEGWELSANGDKMREEFVGWLVANRERLYLDWIEVQYGDDDGRSAIIRHSDGLLSGS